MECRTNKTNGTNANAEDAANICARFDWPGPGHDCNLMRSKCGRADGASSARARDRGGGRHVGPHAVQHNVLYTIGAGACALEDLAERASRVCPPNYTGAI